MGASKGQAEAMLMSAAAVMSEHALQCMEIWSGSHAVTHAISTPGLKGTVLSRPYESAQEGGDIHYVSLCGGGKITRAILADVAGHGQTVASVAHTLRD